MTLHVERHGHGPELVLVHGWGLHGGIWSELAAALAQRFTVIRLDLPGHGRSHATPMPARLSDLTDVVVEQVRSPAIWLGWSLGGLVTLEVARRYPERVTKLVLAAATPRFVQAPDWDAAMAPDVFGEFARNLQADYRGTLMRFLSLQAGGDDEGRTLIKRLRSELLVHGEPQPQALANGLAILEGTDLRRELAAISAPALVVHGQLDRLAPPAAGKYLAEHLPHAQLALLPGSGHAPFLTQPQRFRERIEAFLA